jgi:AcrR family transcriptional regulator
MAPGNENKNRLIREGRKAMIMQAALELFARDGFHNTSVSEIASAAGISKGLLYNYFGGKEDLLREIILGGFDIISEMFDPDHNGVITKEEMKQMVEGFFDNLRQRVSFWKLYFTPFLQESVLKLVEDRLNEFMNQYLLLLTAYFKTSGSDDPETEALLFGALLDGISFNYIANPDEFPVEQVKARLIKHYCN